MCFNQNWHNRNGDEDYETKFINTVLWSVGLKIVVYYCDDA